jgi:hypothetical protein
MVGVNSYRRVVAAIEAAQRSRSVGRRLPIKDDKSTAAAPAKQNHNGEIDGKAMLVRVV